jgi:hypothetical protein
MDALRTFGDDLDPSNAGNQARFGEDWMNSSLCFECMRFAIPVDWNCLGFQDFGHNVVTLLIYPKFGVNLSNGLGDPSIGSWSCFCGARVFVSG